MKTLDSLTGRETEVLRLLAFEFTTKEIAHKLMISKHTADSHRKNLLIKMGVKNTAGLIRRAFECRILKVG